MTKTRDSRQKILNESYVNYVQQILKKTMKKNYSSLLMHQLPKEKTLIATEFYVNELHQQQLNPHRIISHGDGDFVLELGKRKNADKKELEPSLINEESNNTDSRKSTQDRKQQEELDYLTAQFDVQYENSAPPIIEDPETFLNIRTASGEIREEDDEEWEDGNDSKLFILCHVSSYIIDLITTVIENEATNTNTSTQTRDPRKSKKKLKGLTGYAKATLGGYRIQTSI